MDADGIAGEIIFADGDAVTGQESPPFGAGLHAGQITDPRLAFGGARAHNRWLEEFCATDPVRRAGVALVPITHDPAQGVREIESLAGKPGIRGIMVPTMWHGFPAYGTDHYDDVWAACAEAGLVVTIALSLEVLFLVLATAAALVGAGASRGRVLATTAGLTALLLAGAVAGTLAAGALSGGALAGLLAFGVAALLYLVTEELLVEAHETEDTPLATATFFAGFLALLLLEMAL